TADDGYSAYFNRGILASQWVSRKLKELGGDAVPTLEDAISKPGPIRSFLAGSVLPKLPSLLEGASTIYATLYELNDPELIEKLSALGPKADVVLANGADTKQGEDENADARKTLNDAHVKVTDRMVGGRHFAH